MSAVLNKLMKKYYSLYASIDDFTNKVAMTSFHDKDFTKKDLNTIVFYTEVIKLRMEYLDEDDFSICFTSKTVLGDENGITFQQFLKGAEAVRSMAAYEGDLNHNFLEDVVEYTREDGESVPTYELEFGS